MIHIRHCCLISTQQLTTTISCLKCTMHTKTNVNKLCIILTIMFRKWNLFFFNIFVLNKIMVPIFQRIYIQNKTLDPCINSQWRSWTKVEGPNLSPGSFYFLKFISNRGEALQGSKNFMYRGCSMYKINCT